MADSIDPDVTDRVKIAAASGKSVARVMLDKRSVVIVFEDKTWAALIVRPDGTLTDASDDDDPCTRCGGADNGDCNCWDE